MKKLAKELETVIPVSFYEAGITDRCSIPWQSLMPMEVCAAFTGNTYSGRPLLSGKFYFTPGDTGFRAFKTRYGTIGVGICWDQWFPETARGWH